MTKIWFNHNAAVESLEKENKSHSSLGGSGRKGLDEITPPPPPPPECSVTWSVGNLPREKHTFSPACRLLILIFSDLPAHPGCPSLCFLFGVERSLLQSKCSLVHLHKHGELLILSQIFLLLLTALNVKHTWIGLNGARRWPLSF